MKRWIVVGLVTMAAACKREPGGATADVDAATAPALAPATAAASEAGADAGAAAVDLLRYGGASLAVSSNVQNPHDFPEHLVDGRADTAWNGRTGDLVGAWIAFRVPEGAHVDHLEMSVGYDKINKDGDLFTLNHRIKRVRIRREGVVVREHTFDVDKRAPQSIPVDAASGTYRIEILETVPGTKKEWREACVSELRVLGTPAPKAAPRKSAPPIGVGAFPSEAPAAVSMRDGEKAVEPLANRRWASITEHCAAWDAAIGPILEGWRKQGAETIPKSHGCTPLGPVSASFVPSGDVRAVTRVKVFHENWTEDRMAIQTDAGLYVPALPIDSEPYNDPGCFGHTTTTVESVKVSGPSAVQVMLEKAWKNRRYLYSEDGGVDAISDMDDVSRVQIDCAIAGGAMRCAQKTQSRVCHSGPDVIPCDSF